VGLQPNTFAKLKATYERLEGCVAFEDSFVKQSHLSAGKTTVDEAADISAGGNHPGGPINTSPCMDTENLTGKASQQASLSGHVSKRPPHFSSEERPPKKMRPASTDANMSQPLHSAGLAENATNGPDTVTAGPVHWRPPPPPPPVVNVRPTARAPIIRTTHDQDTVLILNRCNINDHGRVALHLLKEHSKDGEIEAHKVVIAPRTQA